MRWTPEEWWDGSDAYVVGGGPSLRSFDWQSLIGHHVIGCNDAFRLGPAVCSACIFGDLRWFNVHRRELERFPNPVFTNQPSLFQGDGLPWVRAMRREPRGLHREALGWGGNTGCAAINLALILGATRVFLLGFDLQKVEGNTNWHDLNISRVANTSYNNFLRGFRAVAEDLPRVFPGRQVINLTPGGRLDVFPRMAVEEVLQCPVAASC